MKLTNNSVMKLIANEIDADHDGGHYDNRLFYRDGNINVFANLMSEKEYSKMEKELTKKEIKGKGYVIAAWNDSSSYDYWKGQGDSGAPNYIQVVAYISDLNKVDVEKLKADIQKLYDYYDMKYNNMEAYLYQRNV